MNTLVKKSKKLILAFLFVTGGMIAQDKVSDAELGNFVNALASIQTINIDAQTTMMEVVDQSGFELDRFNEIYQAAMTEDTETLNKLSEDESKKFESVLARFEAMEAVFQNQMETAITKQNITFERFEAIAGLMENDFALQSRFQALMDQ